ASVRAMLAAPPMLSWAVESRRMGTRVSGCCPPGSPSMAVSRIMSPTTATDTRRPLRRSWTSCTSFCTSCGLAMGRPPWRLLWQVGGGRANGAAACGLARRIHEDDVKLAGAVDAGDQAQLDVAGLAGPGDDR